MAAEADRTRKLDFDEIVIPPGPRLGQRRPRGEEAPEGLRRTQPDRRSELHPAAQRHRRASSARTASARRRCSRRSSVSSRSTAASSRSARRSRSRYVDQSRGGIDPNKSLWEVVSDGLDWIQVGKVEIPSRAYVSQFGFKGPDQQKKAGVLSGGERNRLNLALTLKQGGNLLLLDEPTNDLDVETLGSLENALLEFPGCAVVITHDRWFLDRIATHILAYEGTDGRPRQVVLVRGQLRGVRGEQDRASRRRTRRSRTARRTASSLVTDGSATTPSAAGARRLHIPIHLRWGDLDAFNHVNNTSMLKLLEEVARARVLAARHRRGGAPHGGARLRHRCRHPHAHRPTGDRVPAPGAVSAQPARRAAVVRQASADPASRSATRSSAPSPRRARSCMRARPRSSCWWTPPRAAPCVCTDEQRSAWEPYLGEPIVYAHRR